MSTTTDTAREYVGGRWSEPALTLRGQVEDPNSGESLRAMAASSPETIERALASAAAVHERGTWASTPPAERAEVLDALAASLEGRMERAAAIEAAATGVVITTTSALSVILPGAFRLAAEQLRSGDWMLQTLPGPSGLPVEVHRLPLGPSVALVPWNAPAPMAAHKIASALAAGCPVILKPPELAPLGCEVLAEAADEAGLDDGLFQIVHGGPEQGAALVADARIRAVSFTGGAAGGRWIAETCARQCKPVQLELGGNNPAVVLPDADLDATVEGLSLLLTSLNGQWCRALGRLIVPRGLHDEVRDRLTARLRAVRIGSSMEPSSEMGPIVHSRHLGLLRDALTRLQEAGGRVHAPADVPSRGNFLSPSLVTGVAPEDATEEIFGPVATMHPYHDTDEALALANGTPYGLEAYVFAGDAEAGMDLGRRIHAGGVKVNGSTVLSLHILAPRPAWGMSGLGEEGTVETIRFFCGTRVVGVETQ